ncbi:MAG: alcohol dehydrogenase catalytic domain-containing protein [Sphingomonadales bacterium]|nr:alcohol dehydrogenase catalytic domain-containing protein [Sphingomonadales bacterium]
MRAVLCRSLGDVSALRVEEVPSPPMKPDEVRVAVKAAGVNFPDILMVEGKYQVKPDLPFTPGLEVAGTVMDCGAEVTHVRPGQRVLSFARRGAAMPARSSCRAPLSRLSPTASISPRRRRFPWPMAPPTSPSTTAAT